MFLCLFEGIRGEHNAIITLQFDTGCEGWNCSPGVTLWVPDHTTQCSSNIAPSLTFPCFLESSPSLCARDLHWADTVRAGQLASCVNAIDCWCLLPPNTKMPCSLVEDYTRREVFAKPSAVLKQNSEEDGELASHKEGGKPAFVSLLVHFL